MHVTGTDQAEREDTGGNGSGGDRTRGNPKEDKLLFEPRSTLMPIIKGLEIWEQLKEGDTERVRCEDAQLYIRVCKIYTL